MRYTMIRPSHRPAYLLAVWLVPLGARLAAQTPAPEAFVPRQVTLDVGVDYDAPRLSGSIVYRLENWTPAASRRVSFLLNRLMAVSSVRDSTGRPVSFTQDVVQLQDEPLLQVTQIRVTLPRPVLPGGRTTLRLDYAGPLVGYTEVGWQYVRDHIDTAFTIIREDAFAFPSIGGSSGSANRTRPRPDFPYDASVRVPARFVVATGGAATRTVNSDGTVTWRYVSDGPSPFLNIAVAPFDTLVDGGVHVFYFPADSAGARRLLASARAGLDTLAQWFGPPPRAALHLTVTEIPDGWGSQASLVGGIIQTASAFRDPARLGELYHELSHLWNARDTDNPAPRWNEGLAMFLQDLLRERLDGWTGRAEVMGRTLASVRQAAGEDSLLATVPFAEYGRRAMTGRSYRVGAVMFAVLYDLLGPQEFDAVIGGYARQYAAGGTTRDFVAYASHRATRDLTPFFDDWLFTTRWTGLVARAGSIAELAGHYRR